MGSLCSCFRVGEVEENVESNNENCIWSSCFSHYFKTKYGALFGRVEEHAAPSHLPNSPNMNPRISSMPGSSDGATSKELESSKKIPGKVRVSSQPEEEDDCPICLEEFIPDNPKITTECHHDYHLQCICEWQKRSEKCPICVQVMVCEGLT